MNCVLSGFRRRWLEESQASTAEDASNNRSTIWTAEEAGTCRRTWVSSARKMKAEFVVEGLKDPVGCGIGVAIFARNSGLVTTSGLIFKFV